jgi:hypothetical protein
MPAFTRACTISQNYYTYCAADLEICILLLWATMQCYIFTDRWYALAGHVLYEYSASDDKSDTDIDYDNSTDNNSSSNSNSRKTSPAKQV